MTSPSSERERELLHSISLGDRRAFALLFDSYFQMLGSFVYKITESLEDTEEIVQDVFIKIWLRRSSLNEIKSFKQYLFTMCKHQSLNHLRKTANKAILFQQVEDIYLENVLDTNEENYIEQLRALVDKAVDQLSPQQKNIFVLSKIERLKYKEISEKLNITPETVKKHMYYASKAIRDYVQNHMDEVIILILLTPLTLGKIS
ncbi:RNA polymerase sigma factor [Sphingobacterium spiritivorum]|uniref:RNA polymerase sigma factor n=1 Tax=Sphingobacterium spiritivorum TaxID=258 RepID=UPI003DA4AB5E